MFLFLVLLCVLFYNLSSVYVETSKFNPSKTKIALLLLFAVILDAIDNFRLGAGLHRHKLL